MPLTANDVLNKKFQPTRLRAGYEQDEVDAYLDEVVEAMRLLEAQVGAAGAAAGPGDEQIAAAVAPRDHRIEELERENAYLRGELEAARARAGDARAQ
ncbi:DivIVA domain-containing protein [Actinomyces wuliandei]|uniref:DivIVA domain-containing protein n=1 Tax=Actinomyces wuliandei TaxID=2057743 RepID=UPI000FD9ACD6|nr:DivIVA domain-containing protein [Actinomyces wuliandei]